MHIAVLAATADSNDQALSILHEEGYRLTFIHCGEPDSIKLLSDTNPDLIIYRDICSDNETDDFIQTLRCLTPELLYKCPFLFTFRDPEKFRKHLFGLCVNAWMVEPPDPMLLLTKISAVTKSFDRSQEENILLNTRQYMEIQYCSTMSFIEDMVRIIESSAKEEGNDTIIKCVHEISEGLDHLFHITGALCYEGSQHIVSNIQSDKHISSQYNAYQLIEDALKSCGERAIRNVHLDATMLKNVFIEYNRQELCYLFEFLIQQTIGLSDGIYIAVSFSDNIIFHLTLRMTTGVKSIRISEEKLVEMRKKLQSYSGDVYIKSTEDGNFSLCVSLPRSSGLYYVGTHNFYNNNDTSSHIKKSSVL